MLNNPSIGMINLAHIETLKDHIISPIHPADSIWTGGGILFRNIEEWDDIIPKKYTTLFGCNIDNLLAFARWEAGFCAYRCRTSNYEHLRSTIDASHELAGFNYFKWNETLKDKNSVSAFLFKFKDGESYEDSKFNNDYFPKQNLLNILNL